MGCDIHIVIQTQEPDGMWREVPYQKVFHYPGAKPAIDGVPVSPEAFTNRNYDLFGILANVRNGSGFAGVKMGEGWPSIAADRGWPDGFDREHVGPNPLYPEEGPRYMGDHSYTWVALNELKAFPWDATVTTLYGVVTAEEYERLTAVGDVPTSYCGGISGPKVEVYDPASYAEGKRTNSLAEKPYVRMSWTESARAATNDWPGQIIPWLESLAKRRPLRLIVGFDS